MLKLRIVFLIAMTAIGVLPTSADDTNTEDDVRCMLVSLTMLETDSSALKAAGTMSTLYWMGRLDGRTPDLDLENRLIADIKGMKQADYQAAATRCGAALTARGKFLTDMGSDMKQRGFEMQQLENSR